MMIKRFGNYLLTGVVIMLPIAITIYLVMFLVAHLGTPVTKLIVVPTLKYLGVSIPNSVFGNVVLDVISMIIVFIALTIIGVLSRFFIAKMFINISERVINKIPGIGLIYRTVKQIVETFSKQNTSVFQAAVLVEFPRHGVYSVGFVTGQTKGEIQSKAAEAPINIFVPTTPNPTSGFLMMVPKKDLVYLDMTVGDALKLIVSGGVVVPNWEKKKGIESSPNNQ